MRSKGYSSDLRVRAIELVESGKARARPRAFSISALRSRSDGWIAGGRPETSRPKPGTGNSRSPLDKHKQWLIESVAAESDLTLEEIRVRLA
jgi:hypothetical protein